MKPTMPMNAFPGGTPPPPGGTPPGGGWGGPPSGPGYPAPPPAGPPPASAPSKSKLPLYLGVGCGCFALLGCLVGGGVFYGVSAMGPGEEITSTNVTAGSPFTLSYLQDGSQRYQAWLEVDVTHSASYNLTGTLLLSENGSAFGQYTLNEDGQGSPIEERTASTRMSWSHSDGATAGTTSLFPIPARSNGATVSVSGTIHANAGTSGTIRVFVAKRD